MANGIVNIVLRATGGGKAAGEFGKAGKAAGDLTKAVTKLGEACGPVGGAVGNLFSSIIVLIEQPICYHKGSLSFISYSFL